MSSVYSKKQKRYPVEVPDTLVKGNPDGTTVRYSVGRFLGKGGYAKCHEVTDVITGNKFAAKMIPKEFLNASHTGRRFLENEINLHMKLQHSNIVKMYGHFQTDKLVVILMELCSSKNLSQIVKKKRLSEKQTRSYLIQILKGMEYIHDQEILHRDIKTGNILFSSDSHVKICDFGMAKYMSDTDKNTCGTPNYMPPEVLYGEQDHSTKSDIWSLGVMIYIMVVGRPPFEGSDRESTYRRIKDIAYYFPSGIALSDSIKDLIKKILVKKPCDRPSIEEIRSHEFFTYLTATNFNRKGGIDIIYDKLVKLNNLSLHFVHDGRAKQPLFWLGRWYLHKDYGMFYEINNEEFGAKFNDNTSMISSYPDNIKYIDTMIVKEKKIRRGRTLDRHDNYDRDINKKIAIFERYRKALPESINPIAKTQQPDYTEQIYVKRWMKTKTSVFFRLSNNTVQIHYPELGVGILISEEGDVYSLVMNGKLTSYWLDELPPVIVDRLDHIRDTLGYLLYKNKKQETPKGLLV